MMAVNGTKSHLAKSLARVAGARARLFSGAARTAAVNAPAAKQLSSACLLPPKDAAAVGACGKNGGFVYSVQRGYSGVRSGSTLALDDEEKLQQRQEADHNDSGVTLAGHGGSNKDDDEKAISSYWGVGPSKITKEDGTEWKWSCFRVLY